MPDIIAALVVFSIIFIAITSGKWGVAIVLALLSIVMFMPTQDGIFYSCIMENVKFLFSKKKYKKNAVNAKEDITVLIGLKAIKENGLIEYKTLFSLFAAFTGGKDKIVAGTFTLDTDMDYRALISGMSAR